ncbi:MAG: hypothetical protein JNK53_02805 [Phycisphaerae bacterium]|nr:hypothetical protein [Phycisphaerae bacterium]
MNDAGAMGDPSPRNPQPLSVTTRAILIDESGGSAGRHDRSMIDRMADLVRHWRAALMGALVVAAVATAWQANAAREQTYVALIENATLPGDAGVAPIAKHDLAAMINAMAAGSEESGLLPEDGYLDASVPKVGDLVRITIVLRTPDSKAGLVTARDVIKDLTAAIDETFKPRLASAEAYLKAQIEVTKQAIVQVDAMLAEETPTQGKSDRADLVRRTDELRARAASLEIRVTQLSGPRVFAPPAPQDDPSLLHRAGLVGLAAAAGALAFGAIAAIAESVRKTLRAA